MMQRRVLPVIGILLAGVAGAALPVRWEVEGLSMAPGLLPGDSAKSGWFPAFDRWRDPRRFERWTLRGPAGVTVMKRVCGLPGEEITIVDGDFLVDGEVALKPPHVLGQMALPCTVPAARADRSEALFAIAGSVFDDVAFAPEERRLLVPVRDLGLAAVVRASAVSATGAQADFEVRIGRREVRVRARAAGRHAIVAGRLDGHFVATAWPMPDHQPIPGPVPAGSPATWTVSRPWGGEGAIETLRVRVAASGDDGARIEHVVVWRDVHYLPPATGAVCWRMGAGECFVLGDFPAGSRDSRDWGTVPLAALGQRLEWSARRSPSR